MSDNRNSRSFGNLMNWAPQCSLEETTRRFTRAMMTLLGESFWRTDRFSSAAAAHSAPSKNVPNPSPANLPTIVAAFEAEIFIVKVNDHRFVVARTEQRRVGHLAGTSGVQVDFAGRHFVAVSRDSVRWIANVLGEFDDLDTAHLQMVLIAQRIIKSGELRFPISDRGD